MYNKSKNIWYPEECVLILIDYQPEIMDFINDKDSRLVDLNVCTLATMATRLKIPVILTTVAVSMGVERSTISSLKIILRDVPEIDRTSMDAWEDEQFVNAVKSTGRKKLVIGAILSSTCLTFAAVHALSEGYDVMFVEDVTGDKSKEEHEMALQRLVQCGAVPTTTSAMLAEWFRDWASAGADVAGEIFPDFLIEVNAIKGLPVPFWAQRNARQERK